MTGMNRLSPLIVRRTGPMAAAFPISTSRSFQEAAEPGGWLDDLRLFATGWIGGLIFFGTFLG